MTKFSYTANHAGHGFNPVAALVNGALHTDTSHNGYGFNPFAAVIGGVTRIGATLYTWQQRASERHALEQLDERLLQDMGITRGAVADEIRKPFWRR